MRTGDRLRTWAVTVATCLGLASMALAQGDEPGDMLFIAGTTVSNNGQASAYIVWEATDSALLNDRPFAVYRKDGDVDSTELFEWKGLASLQSQPAMLKLLCKRAEAMGEDLAALESVVDELFQNVPPATGGDLTLYTKLSAIIQGSTSDEELFNNLTFLARRHPAIALCIGHAAAVPVPADRLSTFELREYDMARAAPGHVAGRVTLDPAAPVVLPAPTGLLEVPETTAKGHLNVRLRWEDPDTLKRLSLLSFGYHVYRMPLADAIAAGFDTTPPSSVELAGLVASHAVTRVSREPVLVDPDELAAGSPFFIDDNHRFDDGAVPLVAGDWLAYFVTALDLLGRDGLVSMPVAVQVCDRFPPATPRGVQARLNNRVAGRPDERGIRITWTQNSNGVDDVTTAYRVYRADSFHKLVQGAIDPAANLLDVVPHAGGNIYGDFLDVGFAAGDIGKTFWYALRAVDDSACNGNLSAPSGPIACVLPDWEGPEGVVEGWIRTQCPEPWVAVSPNELHDFPIKAVCRFDRAELRHLLWVEFAVVPDMRHPEITETFCHHLLRPGDTELSAYYRPPDAPQRSYDVLCRVATRYGCISDYARNTTYSGDGLDYGESHFDAWVSRSEDSRGCCQSHLPVAEDGSIIPIEIEFVVPLGVREWRGYRRVNGGPHTLIAQGLISNQVLQAMADSSPNVLPGAELCYYIQCLDGSGNPGPLSLIGCQQSVNTNPVPPLITAIDSMNDDPTDPRVDLSWFCPPDGIERFEVFLADTSTEPAAEVSAFLTTNMEINPPPTEVVFEGQTNMLVFGAYTSGRVGTQIGTPGGSTFSVQLRVKPDETYTVFLRSVATSGARSPDSNVRQFDWVGATNIQPQVPWPARSLPPAGATVCHPDMEAVYIDHNYYYDPSEENWSTGNNPNNDCVGIRIGLFNAADGVSLFADRGAPSQSGPVLPCVLYRTQVTNVFFPKVSGDISQVSPLVMWVGTPAVVIENEFTILNPFLAFAQVEHDRFRGSTELFLLDTQPTVRGAAYRYWITRFRDDGEVERIIAVPNTVAVPLQILAK